MNDVERRVLMHSEIEVREATSDGEPEGVGLKGRVTPFGVLSRDLGGFREKIDPGAFNKALRRSDARLLFNHNADNLLARESAGTLRLEESDKGLEFDADLPDTQLAHDVVENVRAKNITGNSFSFVVEKDEWDYSDKKMAIRTVVEVRDLFDVGPVTYPAYELGTKVSARCLERAKTGRSRLTPMQQARMDVARKRCERAEAEMEEYEYDQSMRRMGLR